MSPITAARRVANRTSVGRPAVNPATAVELVTFEAAHQGDTPSQRADAIRAAGWPSEYAYNAALNRAIDTQAALERQPVLVYRLRRLRSRRVALYGNTDIPAVPAGRGDTAGHTSPATPPERRTVREQLSTRRDREFGPGKLFRPPPG